MAEEAAREFNTLSDGTPDFELSDDIRRTHQEIFKQLRQIAAYGCVSMVQKIPGSDMILIGYRVQKDRQSPMVDMSVLFSDRGEGNVHLRLSMRSVNGECFVQYDAGTEMGKFWKSFEEKLESKIIAALNVAKLDL